MNELGMFFLQVFDGMQLRIRKDTAYSVLAKCRLHTGSLTSSSMV